MMIRILVFLSLAALLSACGVDGEPETPDRADTDVISLTAPLS